jgi:hypothetical protein
MRKCLASISAHPGLHGVSLTKGTRIMVGDVELSGVYRLVLTAIPNDVWRAEISCYIEPPPLVAAYAEVKRGRRTFREWWRDWRRGERDVTDLSDSTTKHVKTRPTSQWWKPLTEQGTGDL